MKKRIKISIMIAFSIIAICTVVLWLCNIREKRQEADTAAKPSEYRWSTDKPDLEQEINFISYHDLFMKQTAEYERALDVIHKNKETFEWMISEINQLERKTDLDLFLLGEDWKKQLNYVPESEYLKTYDDYFFLYTVEKGDGQIEMSGLYNQVIQNQDLREALNRLSREDEVMELYFSEEAVWIKLIGPFFKEKVMATAVYVYKGKEEPYTKEFSEEMWLDENWALYVPYTAQIEGYTPPYQVELEFTE